MNQIVRQSTGIASLDKLLGGGLLSGKLTVIVGATGIGKTQLGLHFANAGFKQEGKRGVLFDMSARGDSQSHIEYAQRMFSWNISPALTYHRDRIKDIFELNSSSPDYLRLFDYQGRRVTRRDLDFNQWHDWQSEVNEKLGAAISFFYQNFVHGVRRIVVDGIEPVDRPSDSVQLNLFEYIYHQIVRKDSQWVARDLFREKYRQNAALAEQYSYDSSDIGCLLLSTSHETMLDALIARNLDEGDVTANANTLIYLGKIKSSNRIRRAMYIAKHRGSACDERIIPFQIDDKGLHFES